MQRKEKYTDEELWSYQNRAAAFARSRTADMETSKDFASYCTVRVLEGGPTIFKWLWADFWRQEISRPRGNEDEKITSHSVAKAIHWAVPCDDPETPWNIPATYPQPSIMLFDDLVGEERALAILRYKYEFSELDIAGMWGVTESRICQRLTALQKKLAERFLRDEFDCSDTSVPVSSLEMGVLDL